jgi:hypothetical protein
MIKGPDDVIRGWRRLCKVVTELRLDPRNATLAMVAIICERGASK